MIIQLQMATVNIGQLNDECLNIIDKFSRQLRQHNGTIIDTEDELIVKQLMLHAKISQCHELQTLYEAFKEALMRHIESPEFDLAHVLSDELLLTTQCQSQNSFLSL